MKCWCILKCVSGAALCGAHVKIQSQNGELKAARTLAKSKQKEFLSERFWKVFFFCLRKINSSLNWEAGASKKSKKNMKTQFIVYGSCLRVQLKPKLVSTVVALWISSSIPNCTVDYNNQFPPFLLHLNDLNPMIHHTTHHNKHEPKKKPQQEEHFFCTTLKSFRACVCARLRCDCVLASINSPSLSRVSLEFRVTLSSSWRASFLDFAAFVKFAFLMFKYLTNFFCTFKYRSKIDEIMMMDECSIREWIEWMDIKEQ